MNDDAAPVGQFGPAADYAPPASGYIVHVVPWARGWELHVEGEGVTGVDDLEYADQRVREFLSNAHRCDMSGVAVSLVYSDGEAPANGRRPGG